MKLKPRHGWFSSVDKDACDGWYGPHKTIQDAVNECLDFSSVDSGIPVYVAQGRRLTKDELGDMDVDFTWEVDTREMLEVRAIKGGRF